MQTIKTCIKHGLPLPCVVCNMKVYVKSSAGTFSPSEIEKGRVPEWLRIGTLKDDNRQIAKPKDTPRYL